MRHTSVLQVRRHGTTAWFDGAVVSRTPADHTGLTSPVVYDLTGRPRTLGIASWQAPTLFQVIEVVEISGQGTSLR
jgi:hypothetical protein